MTKLKNSAVVSACAEKSGLSKKETELVLRALADVVKENLATHENEVPVPGIGFFATAFKEARTARSPVTGDAVAVPARWVPKFKAGKALKDAVEG